QIEITDYCISTRCLGCSRGNKRKKEQMSYQMFTSIVNDLSQMGNRSIVLSGGEPLIHPHIIEFLDFAAKLNMSIAVLTDGLAITSHNNLSEVMGRTVSSIRISIDGFTAEAYRKVRKVNHTLGDPIERLEKAMTLLSKAKQEKGAKLKHIGVCVTLYEKNVDEINAAIDWVSSHKMIDSLVFKFAHGTTDTISNTVNPYICSEKNVKDAIGLIERRAEDIVGNQEINVDYMRKYVGKMGVEAISSGKPTLEMYESGDVICFTPLLFSLVDASGGVYICCHTYYDNSDEHPDRLSFCMGSVKVNQKSYRDIWRETAFERVMKTHKWDTEKGTLICNCNMRDECTRHWKNNELFADAYRSYCQASLTGRQLIANEIQQFADASAQPFWM
ncbi:MAG: radical SAM protein, partial [Candidatus Omnitrophica bacterium]|nr:radical SAM protein [Candidatus Omnitrophota bacterium]